MPCNCHCGSCKRCIKFAKKYIDSRSVLKLTIDDIPTTQITNTTFSFADIAKDILAIEKKTFENPIIQKFVVDPLINDLQLVLLANRILVNIALNVINDPANPPPVGYVKRAMLVSNDGGVVYDLTTYKDDPAGVLQRLNKDTNVINMRTFQNIADESENVLNQPVYNDNMSFPKNNFFLNTDMYFNSNNINPKQLALSAKGLRSHELNVMFFSDKTYTYPANEINPPPTSGIADSFTQQINHGVRKEIQQARLQDWGYASRRSSTINLLPNYYVAHNTELKDGYSLVLRVSYVKYF
jgi:hypothetical protein